MSFQQETLSSPQDPMPLQRDAMAPHRDAISFQRELDFFCTMLEQLRIPTHFYTQDSTTIPFGDLGLRHSLGLEEISFELWDKRFKNYLTPNKIFYMTDEFYCKYVFLLLPENFPNTLLMVGPYISQDVGQLLMLHSHQNSEQFPAWQPTLDAYYRKLSLQPNDDYIKAALNSLGIALWGDKNFSTEQIIHGLPQSWKPIMEHTSPELEAALLADAYNLEKSYGYEKKLIYEVSHGHSHNVHLMMSNVPQSSIANRTDPIRNLKNYSVILNTILRKAAELGGVHPIYIDRISSEYAKKIESTNRRDSFPTLWSDMALKYCHLVEKHTLENYSLLIQKVLIMIEFDLTADLSLHSLAAALNTNASYLSGLFKRETGVSLTEFVNKRRVEHAIYLLTSTSLTVSEISQQCGVSDDNYFIKVFKKFTGKTPGVFRKEYQPI